MDWSIARYGTRLALLTAALGGLIGASAGCGASHDGCMALAQAACDKQSQCSTFLAAFVTANQQECLRFTSSSCIQTTGATDVAYGDGAAAACAAAYASISCDDYFTGNLPAACQPPGNRPDNAACGDDFQCQSLFCARQAGQCGMCTPVPTMGQPCTGVCDGALQCSCPAGQTTCAQGICVPFRKAGEMCDSNFYCLPSLNCSTAGTCVAPMVGQACTVQGQCNQIQSQYCDGNSNSCQTLPFMISQLGDPCGAGTTEVYFCGAGMYCKTPVGANFGVCAALPAVGSPCGGSDGQSCLSPAECINGTCATFDPSTCK
jgi:hypothetical protein